jgi:hypothetical protein
MIYVGFKLIPCPKNRVQWYSKDILYLRLADCEVEVEVCLTGQPREWWDTASGSCRRRLRSLPSPPPRPLLLA